MEEGASFSSLNQRIIECRACPRLVAWREKVAREKRAAFQDQIYWGKPVPNFGDPEADLLIVGLAPAAHGANRTGRMFTGDRSGDWLYRALHKAGMASQAEAHSSEDGLKLAGVMITAVCHCAPPDNKPTSAEVDDCRGFLAYLLFSRRWRGILCLGGIAWVETHRVFGLKPSKFGHGVEAQYDPQIARLNVPLGRHAEPLSPTPLPRGEKGLMPQGQTTFFASYHPSQQNTFTGRLTEAMLDEVVARFTSCR